jgi:thiamine-phosphate pyrophosphorylase
VHLGQGDLPIEEARRLAGRQLLIGVSTSRLDQARAAARRGADYVGLGPMFATKTKHKPVLAGPSYLREFVISDLSDHLPHLAIGGITAENINALAPAGVRGIAVSSCVCNSPAPGLVVETLLKQMQ